MSVHHTPGPWTNHGRVAQPGLPHASVAAKTLIARVYSEAFGDVEQEAANASLIAAAPDMLAELQKAHLLIVLMLNELSPAAKTRFIAKADRSGLIVEGATRHHERAAVIANATRSAA